MTEDMSRTTVGLTEKVTIYSLSGKKKRRVIARIDTGATKSSVDAKLAAELELGPIVKTMQVKSVHGNSLRPIVKAKIDIGDKSLESDFNIADREQMRYRVLIGRNILKQGFLIDPNKRE